MSRGDGRGALAIVLHTHMPYVEGFGTWPFGEEWLWEAIASSYLPLLELLERGAPLTLSLTPVLCDQLEVADLGDRFTAFVDDVRRGTHDQDAEGLRAAGNEQLARELDRAFGDYAWAVRKLESLGAGGLLAALADHAQWTSSATHAVLPLMASDAGVRLQLSSGVAAHQRRCGAWRGGLWLPECAYAPWLEGELRRAGARATCVELSSRFGVGAPEHLCPRLGEQELVLVPIDRATISLVWSERGYPASGAYRDYHHHTVHHHNPWANDGGAYDHDAALALAREHAADFVARVLGRLRAAAAGERALPEGGLVVCALDTELLGHWWYEGVAWLDAVVEQCSRQNLALVRLDDALAHAEPLPLDDAQPAWPSSWGTGGDLSTWSGPAVAELAFATRAAELSLFAAPARASAAAARQLLALQASDWAFMVSRGLAEPYARERFDGHRQALTQALGEGAGAAGEGLRNLAVDAELAYALAP
jgi:1,4-alpha-glucan branching enzyme